MHVKVNALAIAGLLAAFSVVMLQLSSGVESSSLFFISAASFCSGIVIREWGARMALSFDVVTILLNAFFAPDKMHVFTYSGMVIYLFVRELAWEKIADATKLKRRREIFLLTRYVVFNILYVPVLIFFPKLFVAGEISQTVIILAFFAGQIILFVYDYAYVYFQSNIWGKLRNKLRNE